MPRSASATTPRLAVVSRRLAAVIAVGITVAACAGSDGADDAPTAETIESAPESTAPATSESSPDTTDAESADPGDPGDESAEPISEDDGLEADPSADLPTVRPDEVVPVTTVPGPLPTPSIRLIEEAAYDQPIDATTRPGDTRMMVVQKGGLVIAADAESSVTYLDLPAATSAAGVEFSADGGEQGLLGLAFHPEQPLLYVHFTGSDGDTVVAEFATDPDTGDALPDTYREVYRTRQPFSNHNGGELEFGPDGFLYLALGDGGSADDPERASLDLSSPLGSILRFDPAPSVQASLTVPIDNPYATTDGADPLIWSSGLRNPWKFSFDDLTGDLWIADVGQGDFEEINRASADPATGLAAGRGLDFGWSAFEAYERFHDDQESPGHTPPVAAYPHENGDCSVSGGVVARDSSYGDLNGWYVYGDFCSGRLWGLDTTSVPDAPSADAQPTIVELGSVPALTSVVGGPDGDVYALSLSGPVYRLAPA